MRRNVTLAVFFALVIAHAALAATLACITPFRTAGLIYIAGQVRQPDIGAPDERQHVNYVLRLAHGGGFPIFNPKDPNLNETLESHQPPAFYLLAAGWGALTGIDFPPAPPDSGGKEMSANDGIKLRALNVVIGTLTVGGVFMLAFWGYRRPEVALIAAAFAALLPMNLGLSGAVSNDPLLICLCTWTLALAIHGLRDGWSVKLALGVGVLTGMAILTKTTGVALLPALLVAAWPRVQLQTELKTVNRSGSESPTESNPSPPREGSASSTSRGRGTSEHARSPYPSRMGLKPQEWAAALLPILILVAPWWVRNQELYGDPLAMGAFNQAFVKTAQAGDMIRQFGLFGYWYSMVGLWTARSLIGVFGYMDIWLTNTGFSGGANSLYLVAWLLIGAAFIGWLLALRGSRAEESDRVHWTNGVFFVVVVALFLKFNGQYFRLRVDIYSPRWGRSPAESGSGSLNWQRIGGNSRSPPSSSCSASQTASRSQSYPPNSPPNRTGPISAAIMPTSHPEGVSHSKDQGETLVRVSDVKVNPAMVATHGVLIRQIGNAPRPKRVEGVEWWRR